jgi:hypothetical protein
MRNYDTGEFFGEFGTRPLDGGYTAELPPGDYRVQAEAPGYVREFYNNRLDWGLADRVTVEAGMTTPNIDFYLARGGSISGYVHGPDGVAPIPNAWVDAFDLATGQHVEQANTDMNGFYKMDGLPAGSYVMRAEAEGLVWELWQETLSWEDATPIPVTPPEEVTGINFTLEPGGTITGTIYNADGSAPLPGAWVNIFDAATKEGVGYAESDENGFYQSSGLPSSDYVALAGAEGYVKEYYQESPIGRGLPRFNWRPPV